jgi:hypothetical protein
MHAVRNSATPQEVTSTLHCGNFVTQITEILMTRFAPSKLLKIQGRKGNLRMSH